MCGIAGILSLDAHQPVDPGRLTRMRDVVHHRGPDGAGLFVDGEVGLAHRRLAIIDVAGGDQPMANEDGQVRIVFNGEIYNHADLRPWLEARGHRYRSRCDTETILHLYEEVGDDVVDRLHGMFAFAIWDGRRRRLLLARDRLGIKPLYVARTHGELLFASEIKSLLAGGTIRPELNLPALPEFLATRFLSSDETFFCGVRKLLPGHVMTWSAEEGVRTRQYWTVPPPGDDRPTPRRQQAAALRAQLEAAVSSHLMSDVPLGVFLSGGLDSTALAAMAARATTDSIKSFAVGFDDRATSELPYARLAARAIGAEHRDVTVSAGQFFDALPRLLWHEDEPIAFPSSIPLYFVAALARDHVKVVLTGEGADELFLGYNRYRVTMWNARLARPYCALTSCQQREGVRGLVERLPRRLARLASRTFLARDPDVRSLFLENFAVMPAAMQERLLHEPARLTMRPPYAHQLEYYNDAPGDLLDRLCRIDLQTYLVELLMKQDQMSMAASIESRVPFLDDRVVAHVVALPGRTKVRWWQTKAILRDAIGDLVPRAILERPKMGFPVPLGRWLAGEFAHVLDDFVLGPRAAARGLFDRAVLRGIADEHRSGAANHADQLWLLINLEIWNRLFCDGEPIEAIARAMRREAPATVGVLAPERVRPPAEPALATTEVKVN